MPEPAAQGHRARLSEARAGGPPDAEPTLPELLATGWRRAGPLGRIALVAATIAIAGLVAWLLFGRGGGSFSYDGPDAPPFSLSWGDLEEVDPSGDELLRLESEGLGSGGAGQYLAVRPLPDGAIPADAEDEPLPELALAADEEARLIEAGESGLRLVLEGRTELAVDRGPEAYQTAYASPVRDGTIFIVKKMLVPDPDRPGEGVEIEIGELTGSPRVIEKVEQAPAGFFLNWPIQLLLEDAASVRTSENLEQPLRSFGFG